MKTIKIALFVFAFFQCLDSLDAQDSTNIFIIAYSGVSHIQAPEDFQEQWNSGWNLGFAGGWQFNKFITAFCLYERHWFAVNGDEFRRQKGILYIPSYDYLKGGGIHVTNTMSGLRFTAPITKNQRGFFPFITAQLGWSTTSDTKIQTYYGKYERGGYSDLSRAFSYGFELRLNHYFNYLFEWKLLQPTDRKGTNLTLFHFGLIPNPVYKKK